MPKIGAFSKSEVPSWLQLLFHNQALVGGGYLLTRGAVQR